MSNANRCACGPALQAAEKEIAALRTTLRTDELTGLSNRKGFVEDLTDRRDRGQASSIAMFDLDRFKAVNDAHGHAAGDLVLITIARWLTVGVGSAGLIARLHGDEFSLILALPAAEAVHQVELLMQMVYRCPVPLPNGARVAVGFSAGIVDDDPALPVSEIMSRADTAMYVSKTCRRPVVWSHGLTVPQLPTTDRRILRGGVFEIPSWMGSQDLPAPDHRGLIAPGEILTRPATGQPLT